ncbi:MAG: hypothetical protein WBH40_14460 [Ignavibacteriaceae bacterium]
MAKKIIYMWVSQHIGKIIKNDKQMKRAGEIIYTQRNDYNVSSI